MGRFFSPFEDIGFKKLFGQEDNKDILIDFLNDILQGEKHIEDLTFLDKEQLPECLKERRFIYDVNCVSDKGEQFIVEMQNIPQDTFLNRSLYYVARAVCNQACRGKEWNYELRPVYGVFFMNFKMDQLPEKVLTDIGLYESQSSQRITDKVRLYYLQLPFFKKEEAECVTNLDYWIYILKNMGTMNEMPFKDRKKIFGKVEMIAALAAMSPEEQQKHWEAADVLRTNISAINYHERIGREKGIAIGEEKGIEKGIVKGTAIGIEKGKVIGREEGITIGEEKANIKSAKKMKEKGYDLESIHEITGLSIEKIKEL
jgi:predicted transposase/invertase (TIGR01784 family)